MKLTEVALTYSRGRGHPPQLRLSFDIGDKVLLNDEATKPIAEALVAVLSELGDAMDTKDAIDSIKGKD